MNVIYTDDYRGENDDELFLLFKGIDRHRLASALSVLAPAGGQGVCKRLELADEENIYRNGKAVYTIAVKVVERNDHFCSLKDLFLLVEARLKTDYGCNIARVSINTFINS